MRAVSRRGSNGSVRSHSSASGGVRNLRIARGH